jgi:hypothetical protein
MSRVQRAAAQAPGIQVTGNQGTEARPDSADLVIPGFSLFQSRFFVSRLTRIQVLAGLMAVQMLLACTPWAGAQGLTLPTGTGSPATLSNPNTLPILATLPIPVPVVTLPPVPGAAQGASFVTAGGLIVREVKFDLGGSDYPPARFPARYVPAVPVGGNLALRPGSPGGPWDLLMRVLPFGGDVRTDQLEYRVLIDNPSPAQAAGVPWLPAMSEQVVAQVLNEVPERYVLQLRLRVEGHEQAGVQDTTVLFTLRPLGR